MLIKVECECNIKDEISNCLELIKKLDYLCGTTMTVNGIEVEIYPSDVARGVDAIHEDYLEWLDEARAMREAGEVE